MATYKDPYAESGGDWALPKDRMLGVPLTGAPSVPQMSGVGSATPSGGVGSFLANQGKTSTGGALAGFMGGAGDFLKNLSLSVGDSSSISPTVTPDQRGSDNTIRSSGSFFTSANAGPSPLLILGGAVVFLIALWIVAKD